jgi:hypothetical protein
MKYSSSTKTESVPGSQNIMATLAEQPQFLPRDKYLQFCQHCEPQVPQATALLLHLCPVCSSKAKMFEHAKCEDKKMQSMKKENFRTGKNLLTCDWCRTAGGLRSGRFGGVTTCSLPCSNQETRKPHSSSFVNLRKPKGPGT